jgi:excisionase family DNA binding protein
MTGQATRSWMNAGELARYLSVSRSTLQRWTEKGLPSVKVGRVRRYDVAEAEAWLREQGEEPAS